MHLRFIFREIVHSKGQAGVYICCVALSLLSIVALNSFRRDIHSSLLSDAKNLHGGDIIVRSHYPFSSSLNTTLETMFTRDGIVGSRAWEFYSVARVTGGTASLLSNIKAVDNEYPLYGKVQLRSGRELKKVLQPGGVIVAENLLERLGLVEGDDLLLGKARLEIVDVVLSESQRPVDFFDFGPRILVSSMDMKRMDLVKHGSRVHHEAFLKLSEKNKLDIVAGQLKEKAIAGQERVTTYANAESRVKRFFDNLIFFLSLIAVFTLLLAGIGMQSGIAALLRRKEKSIAILRSFGATGSFLKRHYVLMIFFLSLIGCMLGLLMGGLVKQFFTILLSGLLPTNLTLGFTLWDVVESVGIGMLVAGCFTFIPISSILDIKPAAIFRYENLSRSVLSGNYILLTCGALLFFGLLVRQLEDVKIGLYFFGGFWALIFCIWLIVNLFLSCLPQSTLLPLSMRQAIRSLFRPGNATRSIMVTLASALAVLLTIELLENNLHRTYIQSYPEDAPNLFCLDIQKNQKDEFLAQLGKNVELFPVIRARLTAINNEEISGEKESKRRGDRLSREFNLTYREGLLEDEIIADGTRLFDEASKHSRYGIAQVSVLDSVAAIGDMKLGDILTFNVQGVPLRAKISSIRSRTKSMLYPFFYFVFPQRNLERAPQTFFAALQVEKNEVAMLENRIVNRFPNISTINVTETAAELGRLMVKLSGVIDFFAFFSILAGGLILVSSIMATKLARIQEGVYYKIMGAKTRFVLKVFFYENVILALGSGVCALLVAQTASWGLSYFLFKIEHDMNLWASLSVLAFTAISVVGIGLLASVTIVRQKPIDLLREQD